MLKNVLNWIPILFNISVGILFYIKLHEYKTGTVVNGVFENPSGWYEFFANEAQIGILLATIYSFFIQNRWIALGAIATGVASFMYIFTFVGAFNPY
jgi:hypothetical protein